MHLYLTPTYFIQSTHPQVIAYAEAHCGTATDARSRAVSLYNAIRDGFRYVPYQEDYAAFRFQTSDLLKRPPQRGGHCIDKANLLVACCRHLGIPARFRFYNVRNHVGTAKLESELGTNLLVFHGCAEIFLDEQWLKATPAFNRQLCQLLGVNPLDFDGTQDSIFHEFDPQAGQFMEYAHDYGSFHDLPYDFMLREWVKHYPAYAQKQMAGIGGP